MVHKVRELQKIVPVIPENQPKVREEVHRVGLVDTFHHHLVESAERLVQLLPVAGQDLMKDSEFLREDHYQEDNRVWKMNFM